MCAECHRSRQRGLTLIELIMFIVIVGVGLAGILSVMNIAVRSSADPMVNKQALAMADAVLEEIMTKAFANPVGGHVADCNAPARALFDDVGDYACYDGSSAARRILGSQLLGGAVSPLPDTYWASVTVAPVTVSTQAMLLVTVTVTDPQNRTYTLTAYRGNY
ncbi:MAG TPA: type II secretion system protein [Rhodocyclaceae bacterium]|nr:type II secretion system protein [Rhodocyclaceae bacterium]